MTTATTYGTLEIDQLKPGPWNPRKHRDAKADAELLASVTRDGVIQPLLVRRMPDGGNLIVAGERRYTAARAAELAEVPVVIRTDLTDRQCEEIGCIENLQRQNLHPMDEAESYARLKKLDKAYTVENLAARFCKPAAYINRRLRLLALPKDIRDAFLEDVILDAHAEKIAKLPENLRAAAFAEACFFDLRSSEIAEAIKVRNFDFLRENLASAASLQDWIDRRTRLDLNDPEEQARLPELVDIAKAAKAGTGLLEVSAQYHLEPAEQKKLGVIPRSAYVEVAANARCESAERAVVSHGARPEIIEICRNQDCKVHHPKYDSAATIARRDKANHKPTKGELAEQKRQADRRAFNTIKGEAMRAMTPALLRASLTVGLVKDLVDSYALKDISKRFGLELGGGKLLAIVLANRVLEVSHERDAFVRVGKLVGFDLVTFERNKAKAAKAARDLPRLKSKPATGSAAKARNVAAKKAR